MARERTGQGAKGPRSERARERIGQVLLANSLLGVNWSGSEKARYQFRQILVKSVKRKT